jgi:hypothetical protein
VRVLCMATAMAMATGRWGLGGAGGSPLSLGMNKTTTKPPKTTLSKIKKIKYNHNAHNNQPPNPPAQPH